MLAFPIHQKGLKNQLVIYNYYGVHHPSNGARKVFPVQGTNFYSLKQLCTKYVAASLERELRIFDVTAGTHVRTINTDQPYNFLHRVNPVGYNFEYGIQAEACIGYAYKEFFECGVTIEKGQLLEEFQFAKIQEQEAQRKKKVMKSIEGTKPKAIISYCQVEINQENFMVINPREEQDTVYYFKVSLVQ
ncbi:hypothetical protein FGO68_gene10734 [Halteria grandinella]|uniref:Uncharacterized protein n=1 Tax=Halteria grandinella TaxID=5974 RepID=A0A8J8NQI7_HALGN|nr:hypothetical protein FGO68_gene10734 [Halteria grandinella]